MAEHSIIGASGAHRWMVCSGSVALSRGAANRSSIHAATGTVAHWVGEQCLRDGTDPKAFIGQTKEQDGFTVTITEDMARAVMLYVDYVRCNTPADGVLLIEAPFHLERLDSRLWGTSDAVIWQPQKKRLVVVDYKNGSGVFVSAKGNPQLRYYALGALLTQRFPAETVRVVVVQPNAPSDEPIRSEEFDATELLDFAADLKAAVKRVDEHPNEYTPGEHCTFCPGQAVCPALTQKAQELAAVEFSPAAYTPAQLGQLLDWLPRLDGWAKAVREYAFGELTAGRPVLGYKLVDKRGMRVWADEKAAMVAVSACGVPDADAYERKFRSPAQIEKLVGKKKYTTALAPHAVVHSSGVTMASESDKRPAVNPATQDFTAVSHD